VHIQGQPGCLAEGRYDGDADRDIRYKVSIHYIDMEQGRTPAFNGANSFSQGCEVCGEDGRSDFNRIVHDFTARILPESGAAWHRAR
jgi:hypothetical protein